MYASEEMRRKTLMKVTSDQRRVTVGESLTARKVSRKLKDLLPPLPLLLSPF